MSQTTRKCGSSFTDSKTSSTRSKTLRFPSREVFHVNGGTTNLFSLKPVDPDSTVQSNFLGDDHPAYSNAQINEAMVAEAITVTSPPVLTGSQSAIIITWDDSEGDDDHVQPPLRTYGPDNSLISNGARVPFLVAWGMGVRGLPVLGNHHNRSPAGHCQRCPERLQPAR